MDKPVTWQRTAVFCAGLVAAYLFLNSTLNLTNKWILSASTGYGFMFPLALTCCHTLLGFLALLPHMLSRAVRGTHRDSILVQWKGLVAMGLFMAANAGFNNTSLVNMSLSLNQIIRHDPGPPRMCFIACTLQQWCARSCLMWDTHDNLTGMDMSLLA